VREEAVQVVDSQAGSERAKTVVRVDLLRDTIDYSPDRREQNIIQIALIRNRPSKSSR
jgi:hypothetical protein